jgi:hypothetical protein
MLETTIEHGDVCIDLMSDGGVRITRQSTMEGIHLSTSEWLCVLRIAEIQDMLPAPPYVAPCPAHNSPTISQAGRDGSTRITSASGPRNQVTTSDYGKEPL